MSSEAETTETAPPPPDLQRQPLLDLLTERLGDGVVGSEIADGDICVRVDRGVWREAVRLCRDDLDMDYFCFLSGIDWRLAPDLSGEKVWDVEGTAGTSEGEEMTPTEGAGPVLETGVAGGDTRFQVFARFYSSKRKIGITLKADLDEAEPRVDSVVEVYRGADWHERECWEMFGFDFPGHPGLRHLYLPAEFEGHPLRKDFPLLAREVKPWPGLVDVEPMPGEPEGDADAAEGGE